MKISDLFQETFIALSANKVRTGLTILGIVIGIGSALTLNAVADSVKNNAKIVFLQTEQGSFNEKHFANLGFSVKFIGQGFVLE